MKYGLLNTNNSIKNNIGEGMMPLAMRYIYEQMGIARDDIIELEQEQIAAYDGEYVLLPICTWVSGAWSGKPLSECFSAKIVPIFTNMILHDDIFSRLGGEGKKSAEIDWLKAYEPVGCRDEYTINLLRSYGIRAYLCGCVTVVFPQRTKNPANIGKVFIVDIDTSLKKYIPPHLLHNAVYFSHDAPPSLEHPLQQTETVYNMYKGQARLVITSRLHAAIPCMAAGIPVILAKNEFSTRFTFIDKLLPVYDRTQYANIDWNPAPIKYEQHKKRVFRHLVDRIRSARKEYAHLLEISEFYEARAERRYTYDCDLNQFKVNVEKKWGQSDRFSYSLWGLSPLVTHALNLFMKDYYPNAKLLHVYDRKYQGNDFLGIKVEAPEMIGKRKEEFLFLCAGKSSTIQEMRAYLNKLEMDSEHYLVVNEITGDQNDNF